MMFNTIGGKCASAFSACSELCNHPRLGNFTIATDDIFSKETMQKHLLSYDTSNPEPHS